MKIFKFSKAMRIKKRKDFLAVKNGGVKNEGKFLIINKIKNLSGNLQKLGIVVSRKCGKSHERNLFKRRMREIFRLNCEGIPKNTSFVVIPRRKAKSASFQSLTKEFVELAICEE